MAKPEITAEQAIQAVKAAGLDATGLEEQLARRADSGPDDLGAKIERLEQALQRSQPPATEEQRERQFAETVRDHMNASLTPWVETSGLGGDRRG